MFIFTYVLHWQVPKQQHKFQQPNKVNDMERATALNVNSLFPANENRYEGSWKGDKKHGPGKYYYLNKGQMYDGTWADDIARCGKMVDFGRDKAPNATQYPLPKVRKNSCWAGFSYVGC